MKYTRLALAGLLLASALPLRAQTVRAQAGPATPVEKPEPRCVCDQSSFKPLTEKAKAVAEYWEARRAYKSASTFAGLAVIYSSLSGDPRGLYEAQNTLNNAANKFYPLRADAERLGGIKLIDGDDKTVEIKLEKGVDYTVDR